MHTKERLAISKIFPKGETFSHILQAESGRIIAYIAHHPGQHPKEEALAQEQADAERLVAAWNALAGLDPKAIKGLVEAAEVAIKRFHVHAGSFKEHNMLYDSRCAWQDMKDLEQALAALKGGK